MRPNGRRWRGILLALCALAAVLVAAPATTAGAHSGLVSSDPAERSVLPQPPQTAKLTFSESVRPVATSFVLYQPSGNRQSVQVEAVNEQVEVAMPAGLAAGSYVLSWRVVSADSHPISGALSFAVGEPGSSPATTGPQQEVDGRVTLALVVAQVVAYLGLLAAVGLTMFEVLVLRSDRLGRGRERVLLWAVAVTVVAHAALSPLTLLRSEALPLERLRDRELLLSTLGTAPALALALVVLGSSLMVLRPVLVGSWTRSVLPSVGAVLATASVLPVGHTRTTVPTGVMMAADVVHTLAGAAWFGGVIGLGMFLGAARRAGSPATEAAVTVRKFSGLAGLLVLALGVTGLVLGVLVIGSVSGLVGTGYGRTLLVKLGFVAVIGLLAVWNKTHLVPAVERAPAAADQWRRLTGAVRDETAVLVAVICVTGLLVMQSPVRPATASTPAVAAAGFRSALGSGVLRGSIAPAKVGLNEIEFTLRGADGAPVSPLEKPEVTATLPEAGLGPLVAEVRPTKAPGTYRAEVTLPIAGSWQLAVAVRMDRFSHPRSVQSITITP